MRTKLLKVTKIGLYCPAGDFYIDPWRGVDEAVVTHGHGDHARWGSQHYTCQEDSVPILKYRLGEGIAVSGFPYGVPFKKKNAWVSFHPAGHILGSAQVRIEVDGEVAVVSGDYKLGPDSSCSPFEVVECNLFITESTFGLPIYRWEQGKQTFEKIIRWWEQNSENNHPSLLFCYSLGKAQRILASLPRWTDRTIYIHGSIEPINRCYAERGIFLSKTEVVTQADPKHDYSKDLILAPTSAFRSGWMRRFKNLKTAFASGWMSIRGNKRRQGFDKGFILSDHADWDELIAAVRATRAKEVWVTHGQVEPFSRYLREQFAIEAFPLTGFLQEDED